ncbi:MAG: hypothetical protein HYW78_00250 [Parcubacteria group bacterium]|nr:hypothetical protein [Parcubacteria group bacterium]
MNVKTDIHAQSLETFRGTYLGFSPTDESAVGLGEIEVTIGPQKITTRIATGLEILEDDIDISEFRPMTDEEMKIMIQETSPYAARMKGFKNKNSEFPILLFIENPSENEIGLVINTGGMGEILGPTFLFSPTQVARGDYEKAIQLIENNYGKKGVIPRLRNDGKAEEQNNTNR